MLVLTSGPTRRWPHLASWRASTSSFQLHDAQQFNPISKSTFVISKLGCVSPSPPEAVEPDPANWQMLAKNTCRSDSLSLNSVLWLACLLQPDLQVQIWNHVVFLFPPRPPRGHVPCRRKSRPPCPSVQGPARSSWCRQRCGGAPVMSSRCNAGCRLRKGRKTDYTNIERRPRTVNCSQSLDATHVRLASVGVKRFVERCWRKTTGCHWGQKKII